MSSGVSRGTPLVFFGVMYKIHYLKNGMRLVYEKMPYLKTVSLGIFVKSGSMYETKEENGISHFIEHMLFKGTKNRSAGRIAEEMDFIGGHINAYTAKELTCYYTKVLSKDIALSAQILSDMYYNSLFKEEDIELERGVIIEEINMYEDSPEDVALDVSHEYAWKDSSLGYPISGSVESVKGITREMLLEYMSRRYTPENTVISVAGNFCEDELISIIENYFCGGSNTILENPPAPVFNSGNFTKIKDIEQAHLSIVYPSYSIEDDRVFSASLLSGILGGSMSSRLFQKLREENGLCYSIYSYTAFYPAAGLFGIYSGLSEDSVGDAMDMIENEIKRISSEKVSDYELAKAKSQLKCSIFMGEENPASIMSGNGKTLLLFGYVRSNEYILSQSEMVTSEKILEVANEIFQSGQKTVFILKNQ